MANAIKKWFDKGNYYFNLILLMNYLIRPKIHLYLRK